MHKPAAVVFYARDFLAVEFPRMGAKLTGYTRVYIVVSEAEERAVREGDADAVVVNLHQVRESASVDLVSVDRGYNNDRYLRDYSTGEIEQIVSGVLAACDQILARYDVRFYLDEPVSGFPNLHFNRRFSAAGAVCLHFQTSWLPGLMFFTSDPAHADLVPLRLISNGEELVSKHIEDRQTGGALPLYVLNYASPIARARDAALTLGKAAYRKLLRRSRYYLDRDASAHMIHARALVCSFKGGYASRNQLETLNGKYVLYPLHYEPESILNYFSDFSRQEEIAEQLIDVLPLGYELILKEHPSQPGALNTSRWRKISRYRRVLKVRGDVSARALLRHDVAVVTIGSTLAIEAALAGRPVGVLGHVHFAGMPGITPLRSPRDLDQVLTAPRATRDQVVGWYGDFVNKYCFDGNIMKGRTTAIDLARILAQFDERSAGKTLAR